jgi:L-lactate dehydrogenase (cytochrome)
VHHLSLLAKYLTPLGAAPAASTASSSPSTKRPNVEKPDLYTCQSTHDFELVALKSCSPKAWAFFSSAATDCITHTHLNRAIFDRVILRPRVLIDVRGCDITTTILGIPTTAPFFVAPTAMQKMIHPNGEVEMARGAKASGLIHAVSTSSSYPLKEIVAPGGNQVLQLYVNKDRSHTTALLREAKQLGFRAVLVTVDAPVMGKREADERVVADTPVKSEVTQQSLSKDKRGSGMGRLMGAFVDAGLVWKDLAWIKEQSGGLPIVVKGVQNAADAKKAVELGVEGVYLSNHGGRSLDTSPPALLTLLEIHKTCPEILGKVEIIVDGGVRRGTDIFKALCLGATAVAVGRPYIYSLNYGAEGVKWLTESEFRPVPTVKDSTNSQQFSKMNCKRRCAFAASPV